MVILRDFSAQKFLSWHLWKKKLFALKKVKLNLFQKMLTFCQNDITIIFVHFEKKGIFYIVFFLETLGFRVKTNLKNGNLPKPIHWAFFCINTKLWLFKIQDLFLELSKKCGQKVRSKNYKKTVILLIKSYIVWKIQYEKSIIKTFWQKKIVWKSLIEKIKIWKILIAKIID